MTSCTQKKLSIVKLQGCVVLTLSTSNQWLLAPNALTMTWLWHINSVSLESTVLRELHVSL